MTRIHLFNHVEDAWEANLAHWLEQRSKETFAGHETWFITNTFVQANWIRRMALSHGKPLFGIQFYDRRTLRQHLCGLFGLPTPSFGRETLQFVLEAVAAHDQSAYAATRSVLEAIEALAGSGWLDQYGLDAAFTTLMIPERLQPAVRQLASSGHWSPRVDSILLGRVKPEDRLSLGVFGLDAESFHDLNLVLAVAKRARQSDFWIAQPLGKEGLAFQWITTLEQKLSADAMVCPMGSARRPYETFLAHWQGGGEQDIDSPGILVAKRWHDQVEGIVEHVARALTEEAQSILVVVPENSGTGPAVVHRLVSRSIAVADEIRERRLLAPLSEIQILIARFLSEDRPPEYFLRILKNLLRSPGEYQEFRAAFLQSFEDRQVRSLATLINERHRQRFAWLRDLELALESWPAEADWTEFQQRWESLLSRLTTIAKRYEAELAQGTFSTADIDPPWHEIGGFLRGCRVSSELFLRFVAQLLAAQSRQPHPGSHHRYAKVVVTTAAKAHGTSWDHVILTDAISDGWPLAPMPNPLLNDEEKSRFRREGFMLLTSAEQRQIQEERFLQLAYHARNHLLLTRYEEDERGVEIVANDLSTFAEDFLKTKVTRFQSIPALFPDQASYDFSTICANRLDPLKPFDEYFLNFNMVDLPRQAWHPSELEAVFKTPGTFAFRLIFNCRREIDRGFIRSAPMTIGRIAHRLLQQAFGQKGEFQAFERTGQWSRAEACATLRTQMQFAFQKMRAEKLACGPDLWWETILAKALSLASRMLESISEHFRPGLWYQSEGTLTGTYQSPGGDLELEGRTDLILSDQDRLDAAVLRICDFKTSKQPQSFNPQTGDGLQFLGYRLLARANGARHAEILIVRPEDVKVLKFPPDEELAALVELLARLQRERTFGRRPSAKWEASEALPIATLPIDPDILEKKFVLTWRVA
jgi:hypothetical protein